MPKKIDRKFWVYRPLLTDTLPYEVPIVFSNDAYYLRLCQPAAAADQAPIVKNILERSKSTPTIPYSYRIKKDSTKKTLLGLPHPFAQLDICNFYDRYESSILTACGRSDFSLRHPAGIAAVYVEEMEAPAHAPLKIGQPHMEPAAGQPELSRIVSYFTYRKFSLLSKFYTSREFIALEKQFRQLRQVDVSKCFYNIYTHSISWAMRSKSFAKANLNTPSFDTIFDGLMQRANHNETNGIIVGPEFSRVFAEIIMQAIDLKLEEALRQNGAINGVHYAIRRYVDDYSIFAHSNDILDQVEVALREGLEEFKLHINEAKVKTLARPFVTNLTQARSDLNVRLHRIRSVADSAAFASNDSLTILQRHEFTSLLADLRGILSSRSTDVAGISGQILGELKVILAKALRDVPALGASSREKLDLAINTILDIAFYIVAIDLRVRTSYSLCQLLIRVKEKTSSADESIADHCAWKIQKELSSIIKSTINQRQRSDTSDCIELYNLLICGAHLYGDEFVRNRDIAFAIGRLGQEKLTYFKYVCTKYCMLRDKTFFAKELNSLNGKAETFIEDKERFMTESECYHLACDYWSAPDISMSDKLKLYKKLFGGNPSTISFENAVKSLGFVDWSGVSIEHALKRRQLRPVYSV
ncbi:hypothetical protein DBA29_24325 [Xenophilus aerolatus]|nr:hypothetical protein [Xenophilus aerolatus]